VTRPKGEDIPNPTIFEKFPLCGVIATSPLLHQAFPAPKWKRILGGVASSILPDKQIPTEVKAEVRFSILVLVAWTILLITVKDLSHDEAINRAYIQDPLVIQKGTLKGVSDMLELASIPKHTWLPPEMRCFLG
jgi:acylglycerol lipase